MAETELARRLHEELGDRTGECVHCGFCLPACPTYVELGLEMDSPRGRISLVRALAEERIAPTPTVQRHLDLCLACRACETACPSGVRYGEIIEGARAILAPARGDARLGRALRRFALRHLLPHRRRLAVALLPLRLYRALGLQALARRLGLGRLLPRRLRWLASLAPRVEGPSFLAGSPAVVAAEGKRRMRVALFAGCVMDAAMASVHRATVRVLARNGCEVVLPRAQVCCGALHAHDGDREAARALGRRNVDALAQPGLDAVVLNAAGCGVQIREYGTLLAGEPAYAERARWLAESAIDLTVLLDRLGPRTPARRVERRATWDDPCHLLHGQAVAKQPLRLLRSIPGLTLVPLAEADRCCGSAGIYNLTRPEMSRRLLERKIDRVADSRAELLVTANPGCMIQLEAGVRARGLAVEVVHIAELLDRAG